MWQIDPAIAINLTERLKLVVVRSEVGKLVRSSSLDVLDIPEALPFFLGDRINAGVHRDLRVCSPLRSPFEFVHRLL